MLLFIYLFIYLFIIHAAWNPEVMADRKEGSGPRLPCLSDNLRRRKKFVCVLRVSSPVLVIVNSHLGSYAMRGFSPFLLCQTLESGAC